MPLPNMKFTRRCHAKAKSTGVQCQNPAAHGTPVCRNHGARRPENIKRGSDSPGYKHGNRTKAAEQEASRAAVRLRELEAIARDAGMLNGPKTRGRKPNRS